MWSKNRLEISDEFLVNFTNKSMISILSKIFENSIIVIKKYIEN